MAKKLKVISESDTGLNLVFQNTGNNEIMTKDELVSRLETGKSMYNNDYYIKHQGDNKYVVSKPDNNKNDNLG